MPIIKGGGRFTATVNPTRIKGNERTFENVIEASSAGMSYSPEAHGLMVVHEPGSGYRNIALESVTDWKPEGETEPLKPKWEDEDDTPIWDQEDLTEFIKQRKDFHRKR